ncbi:hypothetical protein CMO93_01320 [Candidatus Woesearchaeota archaeon]|nr:hypothetical protein [Candidatus Woesearchaeota archaeon]|tara:strand:+ start:101 stop:481 length:381 start_codon:yes stop_codon:yes gene_type:complete
MKTYNLIIGLLIVFILVIAGCAQQQTQYVCPDGSTVSNPSNCPEQKPVKSKYEILSKYVIDCGQYAEPRITGTQAVEGCFMCQMAKCVIPNEDNPILGTDTGARGIKSVDGCKRIDDSISCKYDIR